MAGFTSISSDIRTGFNAAWAASAYSSTSVYWANDPRATTQPDAEDEFLRVAILESRSAEIREVGSRTAEVIGVVVAQVFTPAAQGDKRSRLLCDAVRDALQGLRYGDVRLRASDRNPIGILEGGPHFQANVTTPFRFESTAS